MASSITISVDGAAGDLESLIAKTTDAVAVVAVMSVQPTSEKWTVEQLSGSAANAAVAMERAATAVAVTNLNVLVVFILDSQSLSSQANHQ